MRKPIELTPEQRKIIKSAGDTIVAASPGTGKTFTLSSRVIELLKRGSDPEGILCITFTRKAAGEMRKEIQSQGADRFREQVGKVHIHTFHSFAYQYLEGAGKIPPEVADDNHLRFVILNSLNQSNALHYEKDYVISDIVPAAASAINYIKSFGILPQDIDIKKVSEIIEQNHGNRTGRTSYTLDEIKAFLKYFVEAYDAYEKSKTGMVDYTDILLRFLKEFKGPAFDHVLIDEMQDMNEMQAEIAGRVAKSIFLVGDKKQAIFGFQGGSTRHLETFGARCERMLLSENRRSTNKILNYAKLHYTNRITDKDDASDLEKFHSEDNSGGLPTVISTDSPRSHMLDIIRESPKKSIGIIARTNKQVSDISEFLHDSGIPHSTTTTQPGTERARSHIVDLLSGLLHEDVKSKIRAAFTVFAPYTLREALGFTGALESQDAGGGLAKLESWGRKLTAGDLDDLFGGNIFPICVSRGPEWFFTARSAKLDIDRYLGRWTPTLEGLLDYLAVCGDTAVEWGRSSLGEDGEKVGEEEEEEEGGVPAITVTTAHKAKGREFDVVIYHPSETKRAGFLDGIKSAILQSRDIDMEGELEGEQERLHFVAFTRAKERLVIILDSKLEEKFHIEGASEMITDYSEDGEDGEGGRDALGGDSADADSASSPQDGERMREAYSLFVAGRPEDAQKLLRQKAHDGWLRDAISDYFEGMTRMSYSDMRIKPSEFLMRNIIRMPTSSASSDFGRRLHEAMYRELGGGSEEAAERAEAVHYDDHGSRGGGSGSGKLQKAVQNGLAVIESLKSRYPGLEVHSLEKKMEVPLDEMIDGNDNDDVRGMTFAGKLDVVFKHDSGYLIIDYKTSNRTKYAKDNHKQLAAYRRMLSRSEGIPEDEIDTCIVFVSLMGVINTGKFDYEAKSPKKDHYPQFEEDLKKILEWKRDSPGFIAELLAEREAWGGDDKVLAAIKERLVQSG